MPIAQQKLWRMRILGISGTMMAAHCMTLSLKLALNWLQLLAALPIDINCASLALNITIMSLLSMTLVTLKRAFYLDLFGLRSGVGPIHQNPIHFILMQMHQLRAKTQIKFILFR